MNPLMVLTGLALALGLTQPAASGDDFDDIQLRRPVEYSPEGLEMVDLELVLAVDVSSSIDEAEARRQRDGHVAALADPDVIDAIQGGGYGRIAIMYLEWADGDFQRVVAPWTVIETEADARVFAATLAVAPFISGRRTAIGAAIESSIELMDTNGYEGMRRVVDISGDGPQNSGPSLSEARATADDRRITINGLPIVSARQNPFRPSVRIDVAAYFENEVIAGPGAFISPSNEHDDFVQALRKKLIIEIAGLDPALILGNG
ncbi:MAG: DUF1194 domain-containing protein [Maricaulis sp.]|jgi:hypothetical protein|nr:DUF1194 domain-containing protein [Maricaulis sp.]MDG2043469.1 DUF1194 domain-containing protein [Maricaulis sp.]